MNGRILELAKNPELFQIKDLELVNSEINKHPYVQSLRALYLFGTHRFKPENYTQELSITAAYTTDKKILYQFINSSAVKSSDVVNNAWQEIPTQVVEKEIAPESIDLAEDILPENKFTEIQSEPMPVPLPVFVKGELNRILFEGEEDFLDRENEVIDLESTIESGKIVTQKPNQGNHSTVNEEEESTNTEAENLLKEEIIKENPIIEEKSDRSNPEHDSNDKFSETKDAETFSNEKIIQEEVISEEESIIENKDENSFHEIEEFSPEVKDDSNSKEVGSKSNDKFSESFDAENFSKEKIIHEDEISEEKSTIENNDEKSFHEIKEFLPEVKIEADNKPSEAEEPKFTEVDDAESFSKEINIKEEAIAEEKPVIEDSSQISFHGLDAFLPQVKITSAKSTIVQQQAPKPTISKHEAEMQRLIAEVEAKMKASKKPAVSKKDESAENAEINFSETQNYDLSKKEETSAVDEIPEVSVKDTDLDFSGSSVEETPIPKEVDDKVLSSKTEVSKPDWQPMTTSSVSAVSQRFKKETDTHSENPEPEKERPIINKQPNVIVNEVTIEALKEKPEINLSSSEQKTSKIVSEEKEPKNVAIAKSEISVQTEIDSNIPNFINTWQSWLQIDRSKEEAKEKIEISITEIKNKVIENFIEKEPRISKLKDESDFVIKERNDDISHLMTETLANLYVEQKLYAKAIKAYGLLSAKHPDKKPHYDSKIQQIKDLRQNK